MENATNVSSDSDLDQSRVIVQVVDDEDIIPPPILERQDFFENGNVDQSDLNDTPPPILKREVIIDQLEDKENMRPDEVDPEEEYWAGNAVEDVIRNVVRALSRGRVHFGDLKEGSTAFKKFFTSTCKPFKSNHFF